MFFIALFSSLNSASAEDLEQLSDKNTKVDYSELTALKEDELEKKMVVDNPEVEVDYSNVNSLEALEDNVSTKSVTIVKNASRVTSTKYEVISGDVFSISVYGEDDLTQPQVKVRPDGYATVIPVGELYVVGLTLDELKELVVEKLTYYIRDPQVSIGIVKFNPASIFVAGAVQKPGVYQQNIQTPNVWNDYKTANLRTDLTISNVIANAGGVTYDADLSHVVVSNKESGYRQEVDLWKLINEGDTNQNIMLKSGDNIYIPKLEAALYGDEEFKKLTVSTLYPDTFPVRIIGDVRAPGMLKLPTESPYINSAVALAQGYTLDARRRALQVHRKTVEGNIAVININPKKTDFVLRPNDVVYVRGRVLLKAVRGADYLSRLMNPALALGNTINSWIEIFDPGRAYAR